jgi:hypothetical protein
MLDFWVDSAIISKCTENRCFPSPQQTSARRAKTAKTLDSPGIGRLPVLSLSAYATISGRSLLRAIFPTGTGDLRPQFMHLAIQMKFGRELRSDHVFCIRSKLRVPIERT